MPARRVPGLFRLFRGRLTVCGIPIKLDKQNCRCPDPRELCCDFFLFLPGDAPPSRGEPHGWEVVQLVGLQTLDLAILVRVQASQPIFSRVVRNMRQGCGSLAFRSTACPSVIS